MTTNNSNDNDQTTIYVFCNETGRQVAAHSGQDLGCRNWFAKNFDINDYTYSYTSQSACTWK